jgi:hypothetical protein
MVSLKPGDVLSYSSGRQDHGPYGFRIVRKGAGILGVLQQRWPHVLAPVLGRTPLVLNAYPATLGNLDFGVLCDCYLSQGTASRAIQLAAAENMPLMILGQSCFVADLFYRHLGNGGTLPKNIILGVGGHVTPNSLDKALRELVAPLTETFSIVQGYGVAEVDSSCLLAVDRDAAGKLVYFPRSDVRVTLNGEKLLLQVLDANGQPTKPEPFDGGDSAAAVPGGGYYIWNDERLHPHVLRILDSWNAKDWSRRTGYMYFGREVRFQLRKGYEPELALEYEFYDYAKRYGQSWLFKPEWSRIKDTDRHNTLRRTILLSPRRSPLVARGARTARPTGRRP